MAAAQSLSNAGVRGIQVRPTAAA